MKTIAVGKGRAYIAILTVCLWLNLIVVSQLTKLLQLSVINMVIKRSFDQDFVRDDFSSEVIVNKKLIRNIRRQYMIT